MKRVALVVTALVMSATLFMSSAQAVVSYGTRNVHINRVEGSCVDNLDAEDDPALCDVRVAGVITIRNSGTKALVVTCPINVWKLGVAGDPVATTEAHLLIKPHRVRTIRWVAKGHDTISDVDFFGSTNHASDYTVLRRPERTITGDPTQVVSCI